MPITFVHAKFQELFLKIESFEEKKSLKKNPFFVFHFRSKSGSVIISMFITCSFTCLIHVDLNKFKTDIADRKQFKSSGNNLLFYCIQFLIIIIKKDSDYRPKKKSLSTPFSRWTGNVMYSGGPCRYRLYFQKEAGCRQNEGRSQNLLLLRISSRSMISCSTGW